MSEAEASAERPRRARRLVAESVTIVFSILLAFAIDAAWDSRRERAEEVRFLSAIDAEIALNLERIEGAQKFRTWKRSAAVELLERAARADTEPDARAVDALIAKLTWMDVGRWQTASIDALIAGGRLSIIEDEDLRRELVTLPETITDLAKVETMDERNCLDRFIVYIVRAGSLAQVINANSGYPPGVIPDFAPGEQEAAPYQPLPVGQPRDHRELLGKSEFLGLVTQAYTDQNDIVFMLGVTDRRLREVQAAIRAALGDDAPAAEPKS